MMHASDDLDVIRHFYVALARSRRDATATLHPEAELHQAPEQPDGATYIGRDEFARGVEEFLSAWEEFRFEPQGFEQTGDAVVVPMRLVGTGKASGIETTMTLFHVWTVREGMPFRCYVRTTREQALETAAGA